MLKKILPTKNLKKPGNTAVYSGISISSGIDNGESLAEEYSDILEQWRYNLESYYPMATVEETETGIAVKVEAMNGVKCDRCWFVKKDTVEDGEGGHLCARCASIVNADFPAL